MVIFINLFAGKTLKLCTFLQFLVVDENPIEWISLFAVENATVFLLEKIDEIEESGRIFPPGANSFSPV